MDTWLWLVIIALLLFAMALMGSYIDLLRWKLRHEFRAPRGNFRIAIPVKDWEKQIQMGAFAVAMTDPNQKVAFTLMIEKEKPEAKGGESTGASKPVSAVR